MTTPFAVLLHQEINNSSNIDEQDVLSEINLVCTALTKLGWRYDIATFPLNMENFLHYVHKTKPDVVFNFVESFMGKGKLHFIAAAVLENSNISFTGNSSSALYTTTNKLLTKGILDSHGVPTPSWLTIKNCNNINTSTTYIIKPVDEDASVGINENSIMTIASVSELEKILNQKHCEFGIDFFAEEYINGREFNVSIIEVSGVPQILSPAEIIFSGFEERNMPKIIDYRAKWVEDSFEYQNTNRVFDFPSEDAQLIDKLKHISIDCWNIFNLRGYARVDFRVDSFSNPYVLEINANPCISSDSSFNYACKHDGISDEEAVNLILQSRNMGIY